MWKEEKVALHTLWACVNTDALLNNARIRAVLSSALRKVLEEHLQAQNAMYHVMCPNNITMSYLPYSSAGSGLDAAGAHCEHFEQHVKALAVGLIAMCDRGNVAVGRLSLSSQFKEPLVRGERAIPQVVEACDSPYTTSLHGLNLNVLDVGEKVSLYALLYEAILEGGGSMLTVYDLMDPLHRSKTQADLQLEIPEMMGILVSKSDSMRLSLLGWCKSPLPLWLRSGLTCSTPRAQGPATPTVAARNSHSCCLSLRPWRRCRRARRSAYTTTTTWC